MIKKAVMIISLAIGATIILQCTHQSRNWSTGMRGMAEAYSKLLPYIFDSRRYSDPKNEKFISLYLRQLNQNADSLSRHTGKGLSGDDPLFSVGLRGLKATLEKTEESYFAESYDYSQKLLQTSLNYCNSCHTRTSMGPTFMTWDQFESLPVQPHQLDKAKILVATRQFPKAVEMLEAAIADPQLNQSELHEAIERSVFVSLKNLESPKRALSVLGHVDRKRVSKSFSKKMEAWKKYLRAWNKTENKASVIKNRYLRRHRTNNHYVSAIHESMNLHKYLSLELDSNWRARAYYRLGLIYQKFPTLDFWELPDAYFETCIHQLPASKQALKCYYAMEKMLYAPTKERGGVTRQVINQQRLRQLKAIAQPSKSKPGAGSSGSGEDDL